MEKSGGRRKCLFVARTARIRGKAKVRTSPRSKSSPKRYHWFSSTGDMERPDAPRFVAIAFQLSVFELDLHGAQHGLADNFKEIEISHARARAMKRDGVLHVAPGKRDALLQSIR